MVLDLKHCRADAGVAQRVKEKRALVVGHADGAHESQVDEGLQCRPGGVKGGGNGLYGAVGEVPAGGVGHGGVDVCEGDGEVNVV